MRSAVRGQFHPATDYELEAYLADELEIAERARLEQQIERDEVLRAYLAERRAARASFARLHPFALPPAAAVEGSALAGSREATHAAALESVHAKAERDDAKRAPFPRRRAALTVPALAVAAAAALAGVWWSKPTDDSRQSDATSALEQPDRVRVKGDGMEVALYVKRGDEVFEHESRTALRPGDRLRLRVDDARGGYLSVLARGESGEIAIYYDRLPVSPGRFLVPDSLLLDDYFAAERWLVIVAAEARSAEQYASDWKAGRLPSERHRLLELARGAR